MLCSQTMNEKSLKQLGKPDIEISGLQIWIHGRQFPDSEDYWDGNWLRVTVHCGAQGASVWATGSIVHLSELYGWKESSEALHESLKGEANLDCMEPELSVSIKAESLGHLKMNVKITPNNLEQDHSFIFEIDQSYLPKLIKACSKILQSHPIKSANE